MASFHFNKKPESSKCNSTNNNTLPDASGSSQAQCYQFLNKSKEREKNR